MGMGRLDGTLPARPLCETEPRESGCPNTQVKRVTARAQLWQVLSLKVVLNCLYLGVGRHFYYFKKQ